MAKEAQKNTLLAKKRASAMAKRSAKSMQEVKEKALK